MQSSTDTVPALALPWVALAGLEVIVSNPASLLQLHPSWEVAMRFSHRIRSSASRNLKADH